VENSVLDEFTDLATTKVRAMASGPLAKDPVAQLEFASAEAGLRSARAFVFDQVGAL
jgi:indole-3-acetate monooxygenase